MENNKLMTVSELAGHLNVNEGWVYDRTRKGGPDQLPHLKIGKYVRFNYQTVMEYLSRESECSEETNGGNIS